MLLDTIKYQKLVASKNWSAEYNIHSRNVLNRYEKFLNRFKGKKVIFESCFTIPEGSLDRCIVLFQNSFTYEAKIQNEYTSKFHHIVICSTKKNKEISLEFLEWYLNQKEVKEFLALHSLGAIVRRLDKKELRKLVIPISAKKLKNSNDYSNQFQANFLYNDPYRNLLKHYINEFYQNIKVKNALSSVVIAGSICELILYNLLNDQETVKENYLTDRGLGAYIDYCRMLNLEKEIKFRLQPFDELKKVRNKIVHPNNAIKEMIDPTNELVDINKIENFLKEIIIDFGL